MNESNITDQIAAAKEVSEDARKKIQSKSKKLQWPVWLNFVLAITLIIIIGEYFSLRDKKIHENIQKSSVEILIEADAEIWQYFQEYNRLPTKIPDSNLSIFVSYEIIGPVEYQLSTDFFEHKKVTLNRDIRKILDPYSIDASIH
ncbi:hypothetical protein [Pleionea sediminis]|uniref:hypothetical protein n=1 Tax=Pleionea sediminis TaxID=2569479 RepID=UPI001185C318|nr:hypothetical protein [Pleionea sediminis]